MDIISNGTPLGLPNPSRLVRARGALVDMSDDSSDSDGHARARQQREFFLLFFLFWPIKLGRNVGFYVRTFLVPVAEYDAAQQSLRGSLLSKHFFELMIA